MCTAIQEMIEDGRVEGRLEGRAEGRLEGCKEERQIISDQIKKLRASGSSPEQILRQIEQSTGKKSHTRTKRK